MLRLLTKGALTIALLTLALSPAAAQEPDLSKAPRMTMAEFKKLHAADKVLVVDVRDDLSFAAGHIPGARNIPVSQLVDPRQVAELKAAGKPIVLYCA
jgi:rhodanese-related sulfurtransferase